ncbi:MAG: DmsC/YnfH family molybdoenzyme membrane anchor subunit [Pseudomonadota bacterium]
MNPAYSIIFFTVLSGAGYGLLIWFNIWALIDWQLMKTPYLGLITVLSGLILISVGLLSSLGHLGHMERAWRALSQWRSSWLSREGVLALISYVPAVGMGLVLFFDIALTPVFLILLTLATILISGACIYSTSMIYASLRTVPAWNNHLTVANFFMLALASGGALFHLLLSFYFVLPIISTILLVLILFITMAVKTAYWRRNNNAEAKYHAGQATGLGAYGQVRMGDLPHSQANFVMQEMGYKIGRKHGEKLRRIVLYTLFFIPFICFTLMFIMAGLVMENILMVVINISMGFGLLTERWLFFAQSVHLVQLYYGADQV